eukprot:2018909-Pyramimonas_sp.AAC.1
MPPPGSAPAAATLARRGGVGGGEAGGGRRGADGRAGRGEEFCTGMPALLVGVRNILSVRPRDWSG